MKFIKQNPDKLTETLQNNLTSYYTIHLYRCHAKIHDRIGLSIASVYSPRRAAKLHLAL